MNTVNAEHIFEHVILDLQGNKVGHVQEMVTESEGDEQVVTEYHTGGFGFFEHLSAVAVGKWVYKLFRKHAQGYVIRWDQLDISDPEHPRLTCPRSEIATRDL